MNKKFVEITKQSGSCLLVIVIFIVLYFISDWLSGGQLTTVSSCSSEYIQGYVDIEYVKNHCPNLDKDTFKNSVENWFENGRSGAFTSKEELLREIEESY